MLFIYNIIASCLALILAPIFILHPKGKIRLNERLGYWGALPENVIWLHGASVGEVNGLLTLVPDLKKIYPGIPILISATNATGLKQAENIVDFVRILPFDTRWCLKKCLKNTQVKLFIVAETELWANLISWLKERSTPIVMVNATISDFTWSSYKLLKPLFSLVVRLIDFVATSNEVSKKRFIELGVPENRVALTGNTKYDQLKAILTLERRVFFQSTKHTVVLGSLRPGEEDYWFSELSIQKEKINIVVAPRHPEKSSYFEGKLKDYGFDYCKYSEMQSLPCSKSVLLVDRLGLLNQIYLTADLAFVGATLIPKIGGHNPLEPAICGAWIVIGPYHNKVRGIVSEMLDCNAISVVQNKNDVKNILAKLVDSNERNTYGLKAKNYAESQLGATDKFIEQLLKRVTRVQTN